MRECGPDVLFKYSVAPPLGLCSDYGNGVRDRLLLKVRPTHGGSLFRFTVLVGVGL